ncbi:nucleotidyltransferase family protein [cf. Phormidesmis sp. LEGE 11477]|uniref:nucleotidyltransferase family protein n=1 Tax=cf. Phormidesmis sp. LEGE 11477 TaxID=1828680 RepID=UPI00187EC46A|nr:nucleotidyltransferase domain-containing protein [cf. Phormidesmis sp. LEGE 11477]MBE9064590.1 nucleotidyltransferase domain-containing protein [cf. Phormidesmis sp. LEGE 11477]
MAFSTHLLDARLARERKQNEQTRQQILQETLDWLTANAERYGISSGYLFGSVIVPNRFTQRSDIDLAVETYKEGNICALMSGIPVMRDVDVVPLDQCHFAEKIRQEGIAWTAKELSE